MKEQIDQVAEFMCKFEQPIQKHPAFPILKRWKLRRDMIQEELNEYTQACESGDFIEAADAIGDMLYLVFGTALEHGIGPKLLTEIFDEIQRANMSKLGEDGLPVYYKGTPKVGKGPNYKAPDLKLIIAKRIARDYPVELELVNAPNYIFREKERPIHYKFTNHLSFDPITI